MRILLRRKNDPFSLSLFIITRITSFMMHECDALLDAPTGDNASACISSRSVCRFNEPTEGRFIDFRTIGISQPLLISLVIYSRA